MSYRWSKYKSPAVASSFYCTIKNSSDQYTTRKPFVKTTHSSSSCAIVVLSTLINRHPDDSSNCWEKRKDLCVSVITSYSPIILCTQQGVKSQLEYLQQCLPGYEQFGISRKGSEDVSDQYCTIFYDKEKVELLEGGTFWLSESPSVPGSMSWGSESPSIATWAISFSSI
ncbi:unnamed protein product [Lactuca saligna]|uniref:Uncharacterized protein n=1 Tax=Lactuca saligna TaxID=75948 RepID=A0AA36EIP3_LACSI|nr:unnamed protein product [Lactuca saligna]